VTEYVFEDGSLTLETDGVDVGYVIADNTEGFSLGA
jgi:hypothetical protein